MSTLTSTLLELLSKGFEVTMTAGQTTVGKDGVCGIPIPLYLLQVTNIDYDLHYASSISLRPEQPIVVTQDDFENCFECWLTSKLQTVSRDFPEHLHTDGHEQEWEL